MNVIIWKTMEFVYFSGLEKENRLCESIFISRLCLILLSNDGTGLTPDHSKNVCYKVIMRFCIYSLK